MPVGQPLAHTQPRSGFLDVQWDQITHTFAALMAATPVAQRGMGLEAPRARKNEGVNRPILFPTDASGSGATYNW